MSDLLALASRVEAGTVEQQRELLEAAFRAVFPEPERRGERADSWYEWSDRECLFATRLDCSAFESAALMLCPPGMFVRFYGEYPQAIIVRPFSGSWLEVSRASGLTNGCAIAAAAIRAHAANGERGDG